MDRPSIVLWDPSTRYWQGSVVTPEVAVVLESQGAALLPCDPGIFRQGATTGFFMRSWGAGWPIDVPAPTMHCPLVMYLLSSHLRLHWKARIMPTSDAARDALAAGNAVGSIRLVPDSGQDGSLSAPVTLHSSSEAITSRSLGKPDVLGGWVIGGTVVAQPREDMLGAFALYGQLQGARIAWAALSQTP